MARRTDLAESSRGPWRADVGRWRCNVRRYGPDLLALAVLVVALVLAYRPVIFEGRTFGTSSFMLGTNGSEPAPGQKHDVPSGYRLELAAQPWQSEPWARVRTQQRASAGKRPAVEPISRGGNTACREHAQRGVRSVPGRSQPPPDAAHVGRLDPFRIRTWCRRHVSLPSGGVARSRGGARWRDGLLAVGVLHPLQQQFVFSTVYALAGVGPGRRAGLSVVVRALDLAGRTGDRGACRVGRAGGDVCRRSNRRVRRTVAAIAEGGKRTLADLPCSR